MNKKNILYIYIHDFIILRECSQILKFLFKTKVFYHFILNLKFRLAIAHTHITQHIIVYVCDRNVKLVVSQLRVSANFLHKQGNPKGKKKFFFFFSNS
jgi:hypothetical protein